LACSFFVSHDLSSIAGGNKIKAEQRAKRESTKRLLVTGGSSYLGRHLVKKVVLTKPWALCQTYFNQRPEIETGAVRLDLTDHGASREIFEDFAPEIIIHTVGSERAGLMVALQSASFVADYCRENEVRLIHLSSDVVFDGRRGFYKESDLVNPLHEYACMKVEVERLLLGLRDVCIVRCSLIYGLDEADHGARWMLDLLARKESLSLFVDQLRNPIWVETLVDALLELGESDFQGLLHVAGDQVLSRLDFGRRLLNYWGMRDWSLVKEAQSDPERWPRDLRLDLSLARSILKTRLLGCEEVLKRASGTAPNITQSADITVD
jgi:dTDP-4-dehydrorhamnose reductase